MSPNGNYRLGADIVLASTYGSTFTGSLDGDGHKISADDGICLRKRRGDGFVCHGFCRRGLHKDGFKKKG